MAERTQQQQQRQQQEQQQAQLRVLAPEVLRYLLDAYYDRFNTHNFPIGADRIAHDMDVPVEAVIESGDLLVRERKAERIDLGDEYPPAFRILIPQERVESLAVEAAKMILEQVGPDLPVAEFVHAVGVLLATDTRRMLDEADYVDPVVTDTEGEAPMPEKPPANADAAEALDIPAFLRRKTG